jgi:hypothetical protein
VNRLFYLYLVVHHNLSVSFLSSTFISPHRSWSAKEKWLLEGPEPNIPKITLSFKIFSSGENFALD